ncbi:MAG: type II toxin-antitoxin system VapC family toxin [Kiritimatiellae bacterium]|nr:type II toxin-antitoxin system VapC family toxin [Kiritimatiellia bacterium]
MDADAKKLKIYCETSFWNYLVGGPTSDEKVARWQALTRKWWEEIAPLCEIYVSQHVFDEAGDGNAEKAKARLRFIGEAKLVEGRSPAVQKLATALHGAHAVPETQSTDALHIAASAINGLDVLPTWNCRHLANPIVLPKTVATIAKAGFVCPIVITPEEFLDRKEEFGL